MVSNRIGMVYPIAAYIVMIIQMILMGYYMIYNVDINQFKLAVTFFVISLVSFIVMTHVIIKNKDEIKGLIFDRDY